MASTHPPIALNFDNIQGDILEGLSKNTESFVFFQIANATLFRQGIRKIIPIITTTTQALEDQVKINIRKASGIHGHLKIVGTNVAFSQSGLFTLGINDNLGDALFTAGQLADASAPTSAGGLGDPGQVISSTRTEPAWEPTFKDTIHGVFIVTGDCHATIAERLTQLDLIFNHSIKAVRRVDGAVRPGAQRRNEHFGFRDGLSQPAVIGFRKPNTGENPVDPGIILLGERGDQNISRRPAWAKDSSFLVFRKLKQFVPEFDDFLAQNPILDEGLSLAEGSELLGARMMGRWKSGAPIARNPFQDNPADAADPHRFNNFDFSDDPAQARCPFSSHVRKMNPRASAVPGLRVASFAGMIRHGISYGPEVSAFERETHTTMEDRGLLFACYQSTLANSFHLLQSSWANNPDFPNKGSGFDPISSQEADVSVLRTVTGLNPRNASASLALPKQLFVVPRGGEYFLSPSISALQTKFAA